MHAEVVDALDAHLAELHRLRRRLTDPRTIEPGERLQVVEQIAASADRLARAVESHRLAACVPPDGALAAASPGR
jgi:transposase